MHPLICPNCGAPLPRPRSTESYVQCAFCGVTCKVADTTAVVDSSTATSGMKNRHEVWKLLVDRIGAEMADGKDMLTALETVAPEVLGEMGETAAFVNVVGNLVYELDTERGTDARHDHVAVGRIAAGYLEGCEIIAKQGSSELNLPFVTTRGSQPVHFLRTLDPPVLADLANRKPVFPVRSAMATPEPIEISRAAKPPAAGDSDEASDLAVPKKGSPVVFIAVVIVVAAAVGAFLVFGS